MHKLFSGQQDDEQVFLVLREHWFILATKLFLWFIFVVLLVVAELAITQYLPELREDPYVQFLNLAQTIYLMFLALSLLMIWILYYLNVQYVTNERVVDICQKSLLHHTISELHLNRIQDVTAEVHGLLQTFLDFGNVFMQTAGETERFKFMNVSNPTKISRLILDLYDKLPPEEKAKGKT